jgi:hypothetical protein
VRMTSVPSGNSETGISLKFARPSGIPMIVTQSAMPVTRCASASSHPKNTIQMMLPMREGAPESDRRTILRPNGHSANPAILKHANPKGIVMIRMKARIPKNA